MISNLYSNWSLIKLSNISLRIHYGFTASSTKKVIGPKLLRITDIQDGKVNWNEVPFCKIDDTEIDKYLLKENDIVFARTGATVGKSYLIKKGIPKTVFASYLIRVQLNKETSPSFVYYFFQSADYWKKIKESSAGIGQPNVNATKLGNIQIPLPPLPIQYQIVEKIEELFSELDNAVENLKKVKAQIKTYRQAVLKYAFEGKLTGERLNGIQEVTLYENAYLNPIQVRTKKAAEPKVQYQINLHLPYKQGVEKFMELENLPEGWKWVKLGEIILNMQYGTSEKATKNEDGIPVLRMGNIQDGIIDFTNLKYFPQDFPEKEKYVLEDGDILFNRTNSAELVGKSAIYKKQYPSSIFASYLIRIKVRKEIYSPEFLNYYINSIYGKNYIKTVVSQNVGQANVNGTKLKSMLVPLLSLQEQNQIVEEIESRFSVADKLEQTVDESLKKAEALIQSILKQAFEGRLV